MTTLKIVACAAILSLAACASTKGTSAGAAADLEAAKGDAAKLGEKGESALNETQAMSEDWKAKVLEATAVATGCAQDTVELDDWQQALSGAYGVHCDDKAFRCSKDGDSVSCEPQL